MTKNVLNEVLHELRLMFGPTAPAMLLCHLEHKGKFRAFVGIDGPWIRAWCELRNVI